MPDQVKSEAVSIYEAFLRQEGYLPEIQNERFVVFRCEGFTYAIIVDSDDPPFFRLLLPNIWSAGDVTERRDAVAAANQATAQTKVAKIYVDDSNGTVSGAIEMFVESPTQAMGSLKRHLSALQTAARVFTREMQS